jgi:hypothetical protein
VDHHPNNSRIVIEIGAPIDGNEKTSIRTALNFGKGAAEVQYEKLKSIIGAEEPNLSVVLVLTPAPGKHKELEELIKRILDGHEKGDFAREISKAFKEGLAAYSVLHSGSNVVLHIKPGPGVSEIISQQVEAILGLGIKDLASTEQASINSNLLSGIDFYDLLDLRSKGYTTTAAFWKSFVAELTVKSAAGSQLDTKIFEILKQFLPFISNSPLPLLQFLKSVDIDFSFKDVDELPASFKKGFLDDELSIQFPGVPINEKEGNDCKLFERITEVLQAKVDVYATLEKVVAAHISINAPGFGVALTTVKDA